MTHDMAKAARALLDTITPGLSTRGIPVALVHNLNAALLAHDAAQAQGEAQAVLDADMKFVRDFAAAAHPTPAPSLPAGSIDDDGCCVSCGRDVRPSPCCPDYPVWPGPCRSCYSDTPAPSPETSEVERAREKCVNVCRRAAEEEARDGYVYTDRLGAIVANAVSMGRALLAAEARAAKEGGGA